MIADKVAGLRDKLGTVVDDLKAADAGKVQIDEIQQLKERIDA